ncbi:ubiquitin carboxyl-terminal hydrolase 17-like [Octodon degus]|uniref:ubiquitinyl hydrolase 1 n=1 Tax=Octodon degus TaxID=10160 RepID=A0A6P6DKM9_OCTDE|nr:ubiquitin carboxyl-terminal hydrolase 17-like [Octodon degus]
MFIVGAMQKVNLHSEDSGLIHQIFGGFWRSQIKCLHCGSTSNMFEPYLDITLDIQAAQSLKQALTQFMEPEELSGENAYHCDVCFQKKPASKTLSIYTSSKVLIFLLKRFSDFTGEKIAKNVQYSEWLNMQPYMSDQNRGPLWYTLYAVLVHAGSTSHSGHYFAYIRAGDGHWYKMNDSKITACDRSAALSQEAYVLFYVEKSNVEADSSSGSAALEEKTLGLEEKDLSVNTTYLQLDSPRKQIKLLEQAQELQVEQSTLDEWKFFQEQNQPKKTQLKFRQVEGNLLENVGLIQSSKCTGELRKIYPKQENVSLFNSRRDVSGQKSTNMEQAPCLEGRARGKVSKRKKNKKNQQQKRTVLT